MACYVLFYEIEDYSENGGGNFYAFCPNQSALTDKINELATTYQHKFKIVKSGFLTHEVKYKAVETIVKYEPI